MRQSRSLSQSREDAESAEHLLCEPWRHCGFTRKRPLKHKKRKDNKMKNIKYPLALLALLSGLFIGCAEQAADHGNDHDHGEACTHAHAEEEGAHLSNTNWQPEFAELNEDQDHDHTLHEGIVVPFRTGSAQTGFLELKLHDDKGDLELWLTQDEGGLTPFDLPLDAIIKVTFPTLKKTVKLQIRNNTKNEDEDGLGNIRDGKTNYFIFPGDTQADASFLVGKSFSAEVIVSFASSGVDYATSPFKLFPHTH